MCHLSSANIRYLDLYFGPGSQDIFHLIWKKAQIFVLTQHRQFFLLVFTNGFKWSSNS